MKKNVFIRNIMTKDLFKINKTDKLSYARKIIVENGVHHLPVVEGEKIVGLISYSDILRIDSGELYAQDPKQADTLLDNLSSVEKVMTTNVETIHEDETIKEATALLAKGKFHSLPVVNGNSELTGMVTSTDLLKFYLEAY
ncbi:MAG: CBS domain-containing protein [Halobacteriovoraceae bacterium]|nr:CBS domain-containing protein [Halobacteriovoraceae bacterium]MCB9093925.1 CBS domain-containing protein [Halobacteriovoraceae bacterium]